MLPALPPKSDTTARLTAEKKRHVRKNPLVIHSDHHDHQKQPLVPKRDNAGFRLKKTPGLMVQVPGHGQDWRPAARHVG